MSTGTVLKMNSLPKILAIVVSTMVIAVLGCSGNAERNAEATISAIKLDELTVLSTQTANSLQLELESLQSEFDVRLVVTQKNDVLNTVGGDCYRSGFTTENRCGLIRWQDKFQQSYGNYVALDSECWKDSTVGSDLPESCA